MGDPVVQCLVQRDRKARLLEHAVAIVGPVQPDVLGLVAGDAKFATVARSQPQVHQAGNGVQLGLGVALQEHAPLRALGHDGCALTSPPALNTLVVKAQLHPNQAAQARHLWRVDRQVQAGAGRNAVQCRNLLQHGGGGQSAQALHQVKLVLLQRCRLDGGCLEEHGQLRLRYTGGLHHTAQTVRTVQVQRRGVQAQLGVGRLEFAAQGPAGCAAMGWGDFLPAPVQGLYRAPLQGGAHAAIGCGQKQAPGGGGLLQCKHANRAVQDGTRAAAVGRVICVLPLGHGKQ